MDDDNWGAAEPIRQSVHDLVHTIGKHLGIVPDDVPAASPDHQKAIDQINKQAMDKSVQDANASHAAALSAAQAQKIRQKAK